eukprot:gene9504-9584_t
MNQRAEYHAQVDRLIVELSKHIHDQTEIKITRVVKAGSFAKFTILRKTTVDPVDVDVVFYISGHNIDQETLSSLNDTIYNLLIKIYPTKSVEDFEIQRKAATVTFAGSGISVDIVPVIMDEKRSGYGWQFDMRDGSKNQTCAPCQIQFIRDRKIQDKDFRTLVRLAKKWRNHSELKALKSFAIELIMAFVLDQEGKAGSIEYRFRRFLLYIAQSKLKDTIKFKENEAPFKVFTDPVVILDPVNSQNNVASRITEDERKQIVAAAEMAWETANLASAENDNVALSYTSTSSTTYTIADIQAVMRRFSADIIMIAQSSGAISEAKALEYVHDTELLASKNYLKKVDLTLLSAGKEVVAVQYEVNASSGELSNNRPGGVLWPRVSEAHLRIVLFYTDDYTDSAKEALRSKLKISWTSTSADTSHATLLSTGGRGYVSNGWGMQRFQARYSRIHDQLRLLLSIGEVGNWNRKYHGGKLAICDLVSEQYPLVIFHGDVGTGKTATAECVANRLIAESRAEDSQLFKLSNRVRGSGKVGEMGTLVAAAFDKGDSLATSRSENHSHHEDKVAVNTLIQRIDDLRQYGGRVVVFLCTNRLSVLDAALQRRAAIGAMPETGTSQRERYAMNTNSTVLPFPQHDVIDDPLTAILRAGARQLLAQAVELEAAQFLEAMKSHKLEDGRDRIVRHGHGPSRSIQTGIGALEVARVKIRDRGAGNEERIRF